RLVPACQTPVHLDHLVLAHAERIGDALDSLRRQVARTGLAEFALEPGEVEEQLLLRRRRAYLHQRAVVQDVLLHGRTHPPHGVGREAETALRLELGKRLHQADVALGDQLAERQAIAGVAARNLDHEAQMAAQKQARRLLVLLFLVALGQLALFLSIEQRKARRLLVVGIDIALRPNRRQILIHRPPWAHCTLIAVFAMPPPVSRRQKTAPNLVVVAPLLLILWEAASTIWLSLAEMQDPNADSLRTPNIPRAYPHGPTDIRARVDLCGNCSIGAKHPEGQFDKALPSGALPTRRLMHDWRPRQVPASPCMKLNRRLSARLAPSVGT